MRCLYLASNDGFGIVDEAALDATTERHKLTLTVTPVVRDGRAIDVLAASPELGGIILEMYTGWVGRDRLVMVKRALAMGRRVWVHWPGETTVECVDRERLSSLWHHWLFITFVFGLRRVWRRSNQLVRRVASTLSPRPAPESLEASSAKLPTTLSDEDRVKRFAALDALTASASPVPFSPPDPSTGKRIPGCGAYLRADFWAKIESGGSYGHTCYVAKELAAVTEQFVCFMAHRYRLLDEYGLRQVVLPPPSEHAPEDVIVNATEHYDGRLRAAFEVLRPAYIYERICIGNYTGALLSRDLRIPYIVEYNGSEISMRRSFDGVGYQYETEYLKVEAFAFAQATMISVISTEVRDGLVAKGVDAGKILVNPNGADLDAYAPAAPSEKARIQAEAGLVPGRPVVGFTGTFGGWHGIDVLAAAIPRIAEKFPPAQFLLIGDGNYKHLVDQAVAAHGLEHRVRRTGRVPQADGARLLKACDIYVSPHSSHMIDSKFFGSPTKIFEYMAMGSAIVASDLEQIGQILSPSLRVGDIDEKLVDASDARSVLCEPGNVDEFVEAVTRLLERPDLWPVLGANARNAVEQHYSWARHVARLWPFLRGEGDTTPVTDLRRKRRAPVASPTAEPPDIWTLDRYKEEVKKQWDNDPAGSHFVKGAEPNTLEWFKEVEAYRYSEYAPWMLETMEFERHRGHKVLELGAGIGTDHAQFAQHGAVTTDVDLSSGHLALAKENFRLRGLPGTFIHQDAETLPFDDNTFDVVYSNGVIHHTPNTYNVVREIARVLKPGGKAIIMVYAENSLHYWRNLVYAIGIKEDALLHQSMGEIMSRSVERSDNAAARPLVKVYTPQRLRQLFAGFEDIEIVQRQMVPAEKPRLLRAVSLRTLEKLMGWNLIIKGRKPRASMP